MTIQEQFERLVRKVGKAFYVRFIPEVRQALKDGENLEKIIARVPEEWPDEISTARFRINYMARAVRGHYALDVSASASAPSSNYLIEQYWPANDRDLD